MLLTQTTAAAASGHEAAGVAGAGAFLLRSHQVCTVCAQGTELPPSAAVAVAASAAESAPLLT